MDSFDKNMKGLYNDSDSPLPQGYGWDDNTEAIYEKMGRKQDKRKTRAIWWWVLAGVIILSSAVIYSLLDSDSTAVAEVVQPLAQQEDVEVAILEAKSETDVNPSRSKENIPNSSQIESQEVESTPSKTNAFDNNVRQMPSAKYVSKLANETTEAIQSDRQLVETSQNNQAQGGILDLTQDSKPLIVIAEVQDALDQRGKSTAVDEVTKPTQISSIELSSLLSEQQPESIHLASMPTGIVMVDKTVTPSIHNISLGGGTLLAAGGYPSASGLDQFTSWLPGYHLAFGYTLEQGRHLIHARYSQEFAVQYFDFADEDLVAVTQEGVVTKVLTHALSGNVREVREDVTTEETRRRTFQTYNTFRSHSMDIFYGRKLIERGRTSLSGGVGLRFTLQQTSQGHILDTFREVVSYGSGNEFYKSQHMAVGAGLQIAHRLSSKLDFQAYIRCHQSLTNWGVGSDISLRPMTVQLGLGLSYQL